ncbi:MAG: prolyl oligopeptidase family serine peptidase [Holosporales bacterium]
MAEHNLIHCDIKDIEKGLEALIAQGLVDPHRIAVLGYSAGARRINSIVATTHRFRAAVSKEGWADE